MCPPCEALRPALRCVSMGDARFPRPSSHSHQHRRSSGDRHGVAAVGSAQGSTGSHTHSTPTSSSSAWVASGRHSTASSSYTPRRSSPMRPPFRAHPSRSSQFPSGDTPRHRHHQHHYHLDQHHRSQHTVRSSYPSYASSLREPRHHSTRSPHRYHDASSGSLPANVSITSTSTSNAGASNAANRPSTSTVPLLTSPPGLMYQPTKRFSWGPSASSSPHSQTRHGAHYRQRQHCPPGVVSQPLPPC